MNKSGSGSCTQPERDGGKHSIEQEPRRPGKPAPKTLESGRIHRPTKATERLPRTPPQVEVTIPTRRKTSQHCESKAPKPRPEEPRKERTDRFSILCFPKSEGHHHRRNGEWPKKGGGTTGLTVPMTRHGQEPEPSYNLQDNSQARFIQLDKTTVRRNQPVQSRSGLRQAPRGRGKRRPAQARRKPTQRKV